MFSCFFFRLLSEGRVALCELFHEQLRCASQLADADDETRNKGFEGTRDTQGQLPFIYFFDTQRTKKWVRGKGSMNKENVKSR